VKNVHSTKTLKSNLNFSPLPVYEFASQKIPHNDGPVLYQQYATSPEKKKKFGRFYNIGLFQMIKGHQIV